MQPAYSKRRDPDPCLVLEGIHFQLRRNPRLNERWVNRPVQKQYLFPILFHHRFSFGSSPHRQSVHFHFYRHAPISPPALQSANQVSASGYPQSSRAAKDPLSISRAPSAAALSLRNRP